MEYSYCVANIISIKNGEMLLLVKKRNFWILPGGKMTEGERPEECIERELSEELPRSNLEGDLVFFSEFYGKAPIGKYIKVICFFGNVTGDITPGAEISEARWVSKEELCTVYGESLSDITKCIVARLFEEERLF